MVDSFTDWLYKSDAPVSWSKIAGIFWADIHTGEGDDGRHPQCDIKYLHGEDW